MNKNDQSATDGKKSAEKRPEVESGIGTGKSNTRKYKATGNFSCTIRISLVTGLIFFSPF